MAGHTGCIVKSMIGGSAKKGGMRVSADFYEALDSAVEDLMSSAMKRAKENNRKTLMAQDV